MNSIFILFAVLAGIVLYVISLYNLFQTLKTRIKASIQEIGNQLKRQASLIPNLEASVKASFSHETGIFKLLSEARSSSAKAVKSGNLADSEIAIDQIQKLVPAMNVLVESNPQMQAQASLTQFMNELRDTSDKLMYSRRILIDLSQEYNMKRMTFPSNLVAQLFGFGEEKGLHVMESGSHLEVSDKESEDVKVSL